MTIEGLLVIILIVFLILIPRRSDPALVKGETKWVSRR